MTFYLTRTISTGYKSAWTSRNEFTGMDHCAFPGSNLYRKPVIKTWKTMAGVQRWLDERPEMRKYAAIEARA